MTAGRGMCLRLSCQFMAGFVALECARHLLCSCFSGSWEHPLDRIRLRGVGERSLVERSMKSATWFHISLISLPNVESLVRGWLLALVLHLAVAYTSHFIRAKSKAAAPFRMKICWLVTLRMVRVWLVCLKQWIFLLPYWLAMHSLHIRRLAQCRGRGRACLFWGKYLFVLKQLPPTLFPSQIWHTFFSFPQSLVW